MPNPQIYDIPVKSIDGRERKLQEYAGKALLIVNVASKCGFTPQYDGLEKLYEKYRDKGFEVLGFPCNQFGGQEPGTDAEIQGFCTAQFGVKFPMFAKVEVNGDGAHPLFQYLKKEQPGLMGTEGIKWNFTKFLVDRKGNVVRRFGSIDKPEKLEGEIEAVL